MKKVLLALLLSVPLVQAAEPPVPLELSDGRVLTEWKILSETPSSVFLKYKGGAAKVGKQLLPSDVLAAHPIDAEGAKAEAANLAAAARAGEERRATVEAQNVRLNEIAARAKASAPQTATVSPIANADYTALESAAKERAEEYFQSVRRNGSGYSLVFNLKTSVTETRPVPGWPDRYEVTGKVWYQYYESTWGGSFSSVNSGFTVQVEYRAGDRRPKVVDFSSTF